MTATTLQELKPAQINPHKHNPRRDVGDVAELADSIKAKGLLEPLIVAPNGTGKFPTFVLIAGHRRLAAAKLAKVKTVPCLVREDLADDEAAQIETMLVENLQRADLSPIEEGEAYQQLLTFPGYTQTAIAKTTGRALATIRGRLKLTKLPDATREKMHAGQITMTDATFLLEFVNDSARYKRLEKAIGTGNWSYELSRCREEQRNDQRAAKTRKELAAAGVTVLTGRPSYTESMELYGPNVDEHRGCEGFAAWIGYGGHASYVCTKPELHRTAIADAGGGGRQAAIEMIPGKTPELAEAAEHRRAHILSVLASPPPELALAALRNQVHDALSEYDAVPEWVYPALDLSPDWGEAEDCHEILATAVANLDLNQCAVVLDLSTHEHDDSRLESGSGWGFSRGDLMQGWRDRLVTLYGYEWTPAEQAMLDAAAAARSAHDAGAGEDVDES